MRAHQHVAATLLTLAVVATGLAGEASAAEKSAKEKGESAHLPSITLVGTDYPDYEEVIGNLRLLGVSDPAVLADTDRQFLRLSLADVARVPFLPEGLTVYQTITTGVTLPVNLNFIVDDQHRAACFNPSVPYCTDFSLLNKWLKQAKLKTDDRKTAGSLARFVVGLGFSSVHHPRDFLYFRLSQKFGIQHQQYIRNIEDIYYETQASHRSEARREEYSAITSRYRDVVRPMRLEAVDDGFRLHAFTYKIMQAAGDLIEWDIVVHADGQVDVGVETLERNIGELFWSWAP